MKLTKPFNAATNPSPARGGSYYNADGIQIDRAAYYALRAAEMRPQIGRDAALRFAINNGSTHALFRIACQLRATANI